MAMMMSSAPAEVTEVLTYVPEPVKAPVVNAAPEPSVVMEVLEVIVAVPTLVAHTMVPALLTRQVKVSG